VAHVEKRGPGRYRARYRGPDGRERSKTFKRKLDAERWAASMEADVARGAWRDPRLGEMRLAAWAESYFASALHKRPTTMARDRNVYKTHIAPHLGQMPLVRITQLDVQHYVETMATTLAPSTVRTNLAVLRAMLNAAVNADLLLASPVRGIRLPPDRRTEKTFLAFDQLVALGDAVPSQYKAVIYLAGLMGLRWSEIAGLRVGRIDFMRRTIAITETLAEVEGVLMVADVKSRSSRRTLSMPRPMVDILAAHLATRAPVQPNEYVFLGPQGGPLRRSTFRSRVWAPAVKEVGLVGLTFHGLRHTSAGLMREVQAHPQVIQQRLGHSSSRTTTDVYGWITPVGDEVVTRSLEALFEPPRGLLAASDENQNGAP
jgi:integrase